MIDTVMALWNHGSHYRVVRIFFTLSLICMSISLLLVTIVIPGYILFIQQTDSGITTANSLESNGVAPIQRGGGGMLVVTPKAFATEGAKAVSGKCVTPAPQKVLQRRSSIVANMDQQMQVVVPTGIPTPISVRKSHKGTKITVISHHVYAGRAKGSVSHIRTSDQQGSVPGQNVQGTVNPFASAVVPHASATVVGKAQTRLYSRVSLVEVPFQTKPVPMQVGSTPAMQMIKDICGFRGP